MAAANEDSVHLCSYPQPDAAKTDAHVEAQMAAVRQVVTLGRAIREKHKLKTRQPLAAVTVVSTDAKVRAAIEAHSELLLEELNVKKVVALGDDAALATLSFKPNLKTLGKRLGPKLKAATGEIAAFGREQWHTLEQGGVVVVQGEEIKKDDVLVSRTARGEVVIQSEGDLTVALDTTMTEVLAREGLMRELVSRVQRQRKDLGLEVSDRIAIQVATASEPLKLMLVEHDVKIREEVLAVSVTMVETSSGEVMDLDGHAMTVQVGKAS